MPFSLFRTLFSQMSTRLAHIDVYIRYWLKYPFLRQPLQPHSLKSLDHSHSHLIKPYPFPCFSFPLHLSFSCISYISLVLFSVFHFPTTCPNIPWNANSQEGRDMSVFIFCSCNPAPRIVSGTLQVLNNICEMNDK